MLLRQLVRCRADAHLHAASKIRANPANFTWIHPALAVVGSSGAMFGIAEFVDISLSVSCGRVVLFESLAPYALRTDLMFTFVALAGVNAGFRSFYNRGFVQDHLEAARVWQEIDAGFDKDPVKAAEDATLRVFADRPQLPRTDK